MKKIALCLLAVFCLLISACSTPPPAQPPAATPSATEEHPEAATPKDQTSSEPRYDLGYYVAAADACRATTADTEYYLDTDQPIWIDAMYPEFPLFQRDIETGWTSYLGTTGVTFELCGQSIFIAGNSSAGRITRHVNLETETVRLLGAVDVFIPKEGESVYYTCVFADTIYQADPSLEHITEIEITIPEQDKIEADHGSFDDLFSETTITDIQDGWIYFYYSVFVAEGDSIYGGNYRIRTDGTGLEKTDEGEYF